MENNHRLAHHFAFAKNSTSMAFGKARGRPRASFIAAAARMPSIRASAAPDLHAAVRTARAQGHKLVAGVDEAVSAPASDFTSASRLRIRQTAA